MRGVYSSSLLVCPQFCSPTPDPALPLNVPKEHPFVKNFYPRPIPVFVCAVLVFAASAAGQARVDRRVALQKLLDSVNQLSPEVRKHLSPAMQNFLRYATAAVNGAPSFTGVNSIAPVIPSPSAAITWPGAAGTIQVSNPGLNPRNEGFTQNTTSSAWCGNSVVVGYEDTGALFRTDPTSTAGVPISLDGLSFSTNGGSNFTDIGFLPPGDFSANALIGDPVVTCSSAQHFQYASILNTTTPDGFNFVIGPSVSFSTNGGKTWSDPQLAASFDGSIELADKPWLAVDPTNPRRMYLSYTHVFLLSCSNIELLSSDDGGKTWSAPTVVDSSCNHANVTMLTGSTVVVSPGAKVYVAYELFPTPPAGTSFTNNAIYFAMSQSYGKTFAAPYKIADVVPGGDGVNLNGHVAVDEFPQIAVDRSATSSRGSIYVTWPDGRDKIVPDPSAPSGTYAYPDILVAKSTDIGRSFKVIGAVSPTPRTFSGIGRDQFLPGIAVDKLGDVSVCYYDRRNDLHNLRVDRYCSVSKDRGKIWTDRRVCNLNWMPAYDPDPLDPTPGNGIGEYDGLTSEFLLHSLGFFGAFEIEVGGKPSVVAAKF